MLWPDGVVLTVRAKVTDDWRPPRYMARMAAVSEPSVVFECVVKEGNICSRKPYVNWDGGL